jgi:hypothetical protein
MSNENQILQTDSSNPTESPDLPAAPPKSDEDQNLQVYPPPPDISAAHRAPRCQHVKSNGVRCGSPALRTEIYCYFHRIWRNQPDRRPFLPNPNDMLWSLPILEDPDGVQMAIQLVLDSVLSNKLELKRANTLLYGLQTAASNVRRTHFDWGAYRKNLSTELK